MESFLYILAYLCVAVLGSSHADSVGELYWKTMLPNARMPKAIKTLLTPDESNVLEASSLSSHFDNKIVCGDENPEENIETIPFHYHYATHSKGDENPEDNTIPFHYHYATHSKGGENPEENNEAIPFHYHYAAEKPLKKSSNTTIFFMQKDLHLNKKMNLQFSKKSRMFSSSTFLPRQKSNSIPFSSAKFPEIFTKLSINPSSREAQFIENTINRCEESPMKGEEKLCATSLEDMIDFSLSKLGNIGNNNKVEAISTEAVNSTTVQKYTINSVKKMGGDLDSSVVCHKEKYPYAVFYCHKTSATQVYMVSLGGDDGGKAEAAAICHQDTSAWDPEHMAFGLLKVQPGTAPICHFLPEDHVLWILN